MHLLTSSKGSRSFLCSLLFCGQLWFLYQAPHYNPDFIMVTHRQQLEKTTLKKCVPLDERSQRVQQGQQIYVPTKIVMFSYVSVGLQMTVAPRTESELETCQILIHLLTQLSWKILWHFNRNSTSRNWKLLDYYFYDVVIPRDCCIWWKDDTSSSIKTYTCHRPVKQYDFPAAGDPIGTYCAIWAGRLA